MPGLFASFFKRKSLTPEEALKETVRGLSDAELNRFHARAEPRVFGSIAETLSPDDLRAAKLETFVSDAEIRRRIAAMPGNVLDGHIARLGTNRNESERMTTGEWGLSKLELEKSDRDRARQSAREAERRADHLAALRAKPDYELKADLELYRAILAQKPNSHSSIREIGDIVEALEQRAFQQKRSETRRDRVRTATAVVAVVVSTISLVVAGASLYLSVWMAIQKTPPTAPLLGDRGVEKSNPQ